MKSTRQELIRDLNYRIDILTLELQQERDWRMRTLESLYQKNQELRRENEELLANVGPKALTEREFLDSYDKVVRENAQQLRRENEELEFRVKQSEAMLKLALAVRDEYRDLVDWLRGGE